MKSLFGWIGSDRSESPDGPGRFRPGFLGVESGSRKRFFYVVRGENGSGKTTLINALLGVLEAKTGEILYNGIPLAQIDRYAARKSLFAVSATARFGRISPMAPEERLIRTERNRLSAIFFPPSRTGPWGLIRRFKEKTQTFPAAKNRKFRSAGRRSKTRTS